MVFIFHKPPGTCSKIKTAENIIRGGTVGAVLIHLHVGKEDQETRS